MSTIRSLARSRASALAFRAPARPSQLPAAASIHTMPALRMPYKDDQDRESLKPRNNENTKSGADEDLMNNPDAAFNPNKTRPEEAQAAAGSGDLSNPLEASGANQDLSKPRGDEKSSRDRGLGDEVRKGGTSKGKSPEKQGKPPGAE